MADTAHTPDKSETPAPVTPPAQLKVAAQLEMFVADICFWAGQDLNEKLPVAAIAEFSRGLAFIDWLHSMQDPNTKITYMGFVFDLNYGIMAVLRNIEPFTLNRFRRFVEVNRQRIENEDAAASNKEPDAKGNGKTGAKKQGEKSGAAVQAAWLCPKMPDSLKNLAEFLMTRKDCTAETNEFTGAPFVGNPAKVYSRFKSNKVWGSWLKKYIERPLAGVYRLKLPREKRGKK